MQTCFFYVRFYFMNVFLFICPGSEKNNGTFASEPLHTCTETNCGILFFKTENSNRYERKNRVSRCSCTSQRRHPPLPPVIVVGPLRAEANALWLHAVGVPSSILFASAVCLCRASRPNGCTQPFSQAARLQLSLQRTSSSNCARLGVAASLGTVVPPPL